MAVTGAARGSDAARFAQVEKVIQHPVLHGSESLCKLLRYLTEKAVEHPGVSLKEYQIATEVFGRPPNFDPRLDSTVRVQTGRLRSKLAEYYSSDGQEDQLIIEIPKGAYQVAFVVRESHPQPVSSEPSRPKAQGREDSVAGVTSAPDPWRKIAWMLAATLAIAIAVIAVLVSKGQPRPRTEPVPPAIRAFWGTFLGETGDPLVVYSNAAFIGRPETGIRYFRPGIDKKEDPIVDHYTGVGEVQAIHHLDRLFALLQRRMHLERGQLISFDDVRNNNVVFVGSPSENLTLQDVPAPHNFAFQRVTGTARQGDLGIFDLHPGPGQPAYYLAAPQAPIVDDYALISLSPGIDPTHWMMVLAGTTTLGTQAAAEYVCRENTLEMLMKRLEQWKPGSPFEAVLHVKITRGVPVGSDLVAVRGPSR